MADHTYICYYTWCHKEFKTKYNLRRHINFSHLKIRNFQCHYCEKKFVSKQNLREHEFIHTGEKPFTCTEPGCRKKFRQASQLSVHRKVHLKPKFYSPSSISIEPIKLTNLPVQILDQIDYENVKYDISEEVLPPILECKSEFKSVHLPVLPVLLDHIYLNHS